jgi:hypothetical protein
MECPPVLRRKFVFFYITKMAPAAVAMRAAMTPASAYLLTAT